MRQPLVSGLARAQRGPGFQARGLLVVRRQPFRSLRGPQVSWLLQAGQEVPQRDQPVAHCRSPPTSPVEYLSTLGRAAVPGRDISSTQIPVIC